MPRCDANAQLLMSRCPSMIVAWNAVNAFRMNSVRKPGARLSCQHSETFEFDQAKNAAED